MKYATYLTRLLQPLGVYDLSDTSLSGSEIYALGQALDVANDAIAENLRNGIPVTADAESLNRYLSILPVKPVSRETEQMRKALIVLLGLRQRMISQAALNRLLALLAPGLVLQRLGVNQAGIVVPDMYEQTQAQCREMATFLLPSQIAITE